jgi:hypothetical protein
MSIRNADEASMTLSERMGFAIRRALVHHANTVRDADADVVRTQADELVHVHPHVQDDAAMCVPSVAAGARHGSSPPSFVSSGWPPAVSPSFSPRTAR